MAQTSISPFKLSKRSSNRLSGCHPDLVKVVNRAIQISLIDFTVSETVRTEERQHELYYGKPKRTWTLKSKHLIQEDGLSHASDLVPLENGECAWDKCSVVADAMFQAADELNVKIRWGGDWNQNGSSKDEVQRGSYDGPHFELI